MKPRSKRMTLEYNRVRMTQILTMRPSLDGLTAEHLARSCGVPEPEARVALERERLFRERARA